MLIAALRTFAAVLVVALYVAVVGPPALAWALLTRRPNILYSAGRLGVIAGFALAGIRLRLEGTEHIQTDRAAVYAANHASNIEPPAVFLALSRLFPRLRIVYKAELRKLPVLVWVWDVAGFVPLQRGNPAQSRPAIDAAARALGEGHSFVIFPEGTRSRTGELLPFKKGGFLMALKAGAPVVPMTVSGGRDAMRKGSPLIWPVTVTIRFSPPVETDGLTMDDRDTLVAEVREAIGRHLPRSSASAREAGYGET